MFKFLFVLSLLCLVKTDYDSEDQHYDYTQVMEEYYLNFKSGEYFNFYNNFNREGDLVLYQDSISLTPLKTSSYGLFYTQHVS